MKPSKAQCHLVELVANLAAKQIGFRRPFQVWWMKPSDKKRLNRLMCLDTMKGNDVLGINFVKEGHDAIALDPVWLFGKGRMASEGVELIAHEMVHFKIIGHGPKFQRLLKKTMKNLFA